MTRASLSSRTILILEDEPLVSLDLADALEGEGAHVICVHSPAEALRALERPPVDAAVIDINLGGDDCVSVCQCLRQRNIPFLFVSGYQKCPPGWSDVPFLRKPVARNKLVLAAARLCGSDTADVA